MIEVNKLPKILINRTKDGKLFCNLTFRYGSGRNETNTMTLTREEADELRFKLEVELSQHSQNTESSENTKS